MSNMDRNDSPRDQGGRTTTTSSSSAPTGSPAAEREHRPSSEGRGRDLVGEAQAPKATKPLGAIIAALLVGLILGGAAVTLFNDKAEGGDPFGGVVDTARYQAVILSNDKVYFGKISAVSSEFYELDSAFFLREVRAAEDAEPERALLPVNREIHAPDNTMLIRKEEVVLIENLAEDSPILAEIERQKG